jgi:signal transduction histidine kinase
MAVTDNGVGIPHENLERIFGAGFSTRPGNRGRGLHSAANQARELGGDLTVVSEGPGRGATFTLSLPVVHPEEPA